MTRQPLTPKIPVRHVIEVSARMGGVSVGEILNRHGGSRIGKARNVAIAVACELRPDLAFETIGRCFRGRGRKSIANAWEHMRKEIAADEELAAFVASVRLEACTWTPPETVPVLVEVRRGA